MKHSAKNHEFLLTFSRARPNEIDTGIPIYHRLYFSLERAEIHSLHRKSKTKVIESRTLSASKFTTRTRPLRNPMTSLDCWGGASEEVRSINWGENKADPSDLLVPKRIFAAG
jgi:hypothetical protein